MNVFICICIHFLITCHWSNYHILRLNIPSNDLILTYVLMILMFILSPYKYCSIYILLFICVILSLTARKVYWLNHLIITSFI
jgi:hypothetical protein